MSEQVYTRPYRVFQGLVNYGTQAGLIARGLRDSGIEAYALTHPDPFNRLTDYQLKHGGSIPRKILKQVNNYLKRTSCLLKFDIFHFYAGTSLWPYQFDFRVLNALRKPIVMEYLGLDIQGYQASIEKYKWTNVTGRLSPETGRLHDQNIKKRVKFETTACAKRLVCAPNYWEFATDSEIVPLAIDLAPYSPSPLPPFEGIFKLLHLPTHTGNKGTQYIVDAVERLKSRGFPVALKIVQGVPHSSLPKLYADCHIFIDQLLVGWYGTATIEAMACGRPVVVSLRDEYRALTPYGNGVPAVAADPDTIYSALESLINAGHPRLTEIGLESRKFVERIHSVGVVVKKLVEIYDAVWATYHGDGRGNIRSLRPNYTAKK